jgi:hypothetical protein
LKIIKSSVTVDGWEHLPTHVDDTGILMAYGAAHPATKIPAVLEIMELRNLEPAFMMINRVPPGVVAPPHIDTLPFPVERWHLPLVTNPDAYWWDEHDNKFIYMPVGYWHGPVPYYIRHAIVNFGLTERVHLVVDLKL